MHHLQLIWVPLIFGWSLSLGGQIVLTGSAVVVTFDGTPTEAGNGSFLGDGFAPLPLSGQLDSDAFAFTGFSVGDSDFGDVRTSDDYARGSTSGGSQLGGIYATSVASQFTLGSGATAGGQALFIRLTGEDFTPGTMTLRAVNQTGGTLTGITVSADVCLADDRSGASNFEFAYSQDGNVFTKTSFSVTTADGPTGTAVCNPTGPINISGLSVAPGDPFFLRLQSNDPSGPTAGQLDAIALDNITFGTFVLPVRLQDFTAHPTNDGIQLLWTTATERNNDFFALERSRDARDWTTVTHMNGSPTSDTPRHYQFLDRAAPLGLVYYRLRQVDYDGTVAYHRLISVEQPGDAERGVFPNPVYDRLHLHVREATELTVTDALGRPLTFRRFGDAGRYSVRTEGWPPGVYLVTLRHGGQPTTQRIVKP